jgi:O-acetyl-ADP-ribose deacetylase (regulator of RNase III)
MQTIFHFRSIDRGQVEAWQKVLGHLKGVEFSHGDWFSADFANTLSKFDALVSPANSFGFMGGGIDLPLRQRYPEIQERVQEMIRSEHAGELIVGMCDSILTHDLPTTLIVCPTVRTANDAAASTVNAYLAMKGLLRWCNNQREVRRVLVPGLCTGVAGMPSHRSAVQILAAIKAFRGEKLPNQVCVLSIYDQRGETGMAANDRFLKTA